MCDPSEMSDCQFVGKWKGVFSFQDTKTWEMSPGVCKLRLKICSLALSDKMVGTCIRRITLHDRYMHADIQGDCICTLTSRALFLV